MSRLPGRSGFTSIATFHHVMLFRKLMRQEIFAMVNAAGCEMRTPLTTMLFSPNSVSHGCGRQGDLDGSLCLLDAPHWKNQRHERCILMQQSTIHDAWQSFGSLLSLNAWF
jgi:hypothetical protein